MQKTKFFLLSIILCTITHAFAQRVTLQAEQMSLEEVILSLKQQTAYGYVADSLVWKTGLSIIPCDEPVVNAESILYREERYTYLQALENGVALRISYPCVRAVMKGYPLLEGAIRQLAERQDGQYREQEAFRQLTVPERIEHVIARYFPLGSRISLHIQLMHMQTTDQLFRSYMRRSRNQTDNN